LYGWDQFTIEILYSFPKEGNWKERLDDLEIHEIAKRNTLAPNGYNNETGGNKNKVLHENTKKLMSEMRSGERHAMFGKHHTEDVRELIKEANVKAVQQWSKDGKELLRTFESIAEAGFLTGSYGSHITKVCKGERRTTGGFQWKFVNPDDIDTKTVLKFTKVQQWSFDGNTLIQEFNTLREASEKTHTDRSSISRCCKGKGRSAGGFKWKVI
jgi:group I intron endonuclease